MGAFSADDGTRLAYHVLGEGRPVVCLPGGPMQDSAYLGDLGGLSSHRRLILLDPRGTGGSGTPADLGSYRCDHLVDDVEGLRLHLGLDRIDLLGHSAGSNLAVSYAVRHPEHVATLLLIAPSTFAVDLAATTEIRRELVQLRRDEPWFAPASAAFESIAAGQATDADWEAITPFTYGRWDAAARAHVASAEKRQNVDAAAVFNAEGAYDPPTTRTALARFESPVLVLAGELDLAAPPRIMTEFASLFGNATLATQPRAGHYPWLDDPTWFTTTTTTFLG